MPETEKITIEETAPATPVAEVTESSLQEANLSPDEIKMAKDQGMISEKKEDKKAESKEPEQKASLSVEELDSFEKIHDLYQTNAAEFYKLPKHVRNLYHNSKGLYKRAKEEEEKRKELEGKAEFNRVHDSVARVKLDRVRQRLASPDGLTVEELQELIGIEQKLEDDKPLTKKDLEAIEAAKVEKTNAEKAEIEAKQAKMQRKVLDTEAYAKENISELTGGKYTNVDDVVALVQEMTVKKPRYAKQLNEAFADESMTEADIFDVILDIARLNSKFGTSAKAEGNDGNVEKMMKNASKQTTSASITGGKSSRVVTPDELTPEDAAKLSQEQWNKLPRHVKDRILKSAA